MKSSHSLVLPFRPKTFLYSLLRTVLMVLVSLISTLAMSLGGMRSLMSKQVWYSSSDMWCNPLN